MRQANLPSDVLVLGYSAFESQAKEGLSVAQEAVAAIAVRGEV